MDVKKEKRLSISKTSFYNQTSESNEEIVFLSYFIFFLSSIMIESHQKKKCNSNILCSNGRHVNFISFSTINYRGLIDYQHRL